MCECVYGVAISFSDTRIQIYTSHKCAQKVEFSGRVCINANVVVGESIITAAAFFEGAPGRPSQPFWGPQQGRQVILWEGLSPEDQERYRVDLQKDANWVIWCKAKPKDIDIPDICKKLVETGRRKRVRGPNQHAMLGASGHAHQY